MLVKNLFFCVGLFCCQWANAQFNAGVSAGVNLANTREEVDGVMITNGFLPRLNAGVDVTYFFNRSWGIQSGAYYAGKGYRVKPRDNFDSIIVRLDYLEVPLKLSYRLKAYEENWLVISTGLYGAYGFKGKTTYTGSPERTEDPFKAWPFNRWDLGYLIESTYGIKNNFSAKLAYTHGLRPLRYYPDDKMKNFLFNASLVFSFK
jgi:hypothetical protein